MEIPRLRLFMQGLHALESGNVTPKRIAEVGLAHAVTAARSERIGPSAEEVAEKFIAYSKLRDAEREGIIVMGIIAPVVSSDVG